MFDLAQGCIIRAKVVDQWGRNPKCRPLVIVTATSEIRSGTPFVAVAITGQFSQPPASDEVMLPWHRHVMARTRLRKPSVAKCSWLCEITHEDVVEVKGCVPRSQMEQIIERVRER